MWDVVDFFFFLELHDVEMRTVGPGRAHLHTEQSNATRCLFWKWPWQSWSCFASNQRSDVAPLKGVFSKHDEPFLVFLIYA